MPFDADAAYLAITSRDARFDGRFFVGVTSTGIYCRPICRVRTPMRKNCRFFETHAQAEAASFRPCMKCRPEIAPGAGLPWTVMDASRTLARQAADELDAQAASGDTPSLADLAARLGVSDRHLRRIFVTEHGVTPLQYLQTRRLLLAKQLLTDSSLPVSQVALASGFKSLRRFNAAFAESYRMSPSRLRGKAGSDDEGARIAGKTPPSADGKGASTTASATSSSTTAIATATATATAAATATTTGIDAVCVTLAYRAPYDVPSLLRFITLRAIPGVEAVEGRTIRRTLRAGTVSERAGWIEAGFDDRTATVRLRFAPELAPASGRVLAAVRRWLDLDASPQTIDAALANLPGAPGLRLPGSLDAFELAVRAVLGQQVTVAAARTLARRLVERFGEPLATPWADVQRAFPSPAVMAELAVDQIAELGIIRTRAGAIIAIAKAWPQIAAHLGVRSRAEPLIEALVALPGIGPWTAHYIAMRALGWPDAFPLHDVAVLKAIKQLFETTSQREADVHARAWQPWRSYAVLRLWNSLETPRP